jgi:hypothetical protein
MNEANIDHFVAIYREELRKVVTEYPKEYFYDVADVDKVADRMALAFRRGSFNYDGRAIKAACHRVGIRHGQAAMLRYFGLRK